MEEGFPFLYHVIVKYHVGSGVSVVAYCCLNHFSRTSISILCTDIVSHHSLFSLSDMTLSSFVNTQTFDMAWQQSPEQTAAQFIPQQQYLNYRAHIPQPADIKHVVTSKSDSDLKAALKQQIKHETNDSKESLKLQQEMLDELRFEVANENALADIPTMIAPSLEREEAAEMNENQPPAKMLSEKEMLSQLLGSADQFSAKKVKSDTIGGTSLNLLF